MREVSNKQNEIYEFLKTYADNKGYPPSVREICEAVGLKSTSSVHGHLKRLESKGLIKRDPTKPRALEIIDSSIKKEMVNIPIVGKVTAGMPILANENVEDIFPIPLDYIKHNKELFMLNISGDSMINAGIFDKDLILVKQQRSAENGDIVVALIDDDYATVKRFFAENGHIRLQPENPAMSPIIVEKCTILGKVTGLFRKF